MNQRSSYFTHHTYDTFTSISLVDDQYATEPLFMVKQAKQQEYEEELHRLFEQAISDRVLTVSARSKHISRPLPHSLPHTDHTQGICSVTAAPSSEPLGQNGNVGREPSLLSLERRHGLLFISFALFFLLSGFDLMGLLVLHMR